jgi:hypothetical protein
MRIFGPAFLAVAVALGLCCELLGAQATRQAASSQTAAQQEHKRLTNSDVVGMVKAGLAESTILLAIEQNQSEFDTSPAALVELKNQGVSTAVLEAMMRARDSEPAPSERPGPSPVPSNESKTEGVELLAEGVYYKGPAGWVKLEQIMMAGGGAKHMAKVLVPGLTPQIVWTFRGAEAPVQISEPKPTLLVKQSPYMANVPGHSDRDIVLVRFDKKKDHRELQTTSGGNLLTFKSGFSKDKTPDITVTRLSETIFKVTPNADLQPGEYLLTFGAGGALGYDFGITRR